MSKFEERETRRKSIVGAFVANESFPEKETTETGEECSIIIKPKEKEEKRTKRLNLLVTPSAYDKAQIKCKSMGISLNECINQFLNNWANQ